jgi:hypothetical protein
MSNDLALTRCQKLTGTPAASVLQIAEWFGAVQAQDFGCTAGPGAGHFVPAADLRRMGRQPRIRFCGPDQGLTADAP